MFNRAEEGVSQLVGRGSVMFCCEQCRLAVTSHQISFLIVGGSFHAEASSEGSQYKEIFVR